MATVLEEKLNKDVEINKSTLNPNIRNKNNMIRSFARNGVENIAA